ncbi:MAG: T9SS type A sorting domain-containing protein [Bacteroidales bacterium]|nr:T9SS type A sorting domain-containing protein [Bacteroidales bacterium]MDZ4203537.1 T9SS type A sorting domain-containing protein [Bacteroidales bacterium]
MAKQFFLFLILVPVFFVCKSQSTELLQKKSHNPDEIKSRHILSTPVDIRILTRLPAVLYESSGVVVTHPNKIWSHEDSGNASELYCFDTTGQLLRTLVISNVQNIDWEDLASDNVGRIYICDAGNNDNNRKNLAVYRIPNPETISGNTTTAEIIRFVLSDQTQFPPPQSNRNFDIEAMIWRSDTLFLFTKNRSTPINGYSKMYKLPAQPGNRTAQLVDSVYLGNSIEVARVTAADILPQTGELVLLTARKIISFSNYPGNRFFSGDRVEYVFSTFPGQNEGLAFVTPNRLYMTEEGSGSLAGFLYEIVLPTTGGTNHLKEEPILITYPNPTKDLLTIECPWPDTTRLQIFDVQGNLLHQATLGESRQLDVSGLNTGVYLLNLQYGQQMVTRRIIRK